MGKKGARNRNSALKKKATVNPENVKLNQDKSVPKIATKAMKKRSSDELIVSLRSMQKSLINTFRSRLSSSKNVYNQDFEVFPETNFPNLDQILSSLVNEMAEEILSLIKEYPKNLTNFLLEAYQCMQSGSLLFEKISNSKSIVTISKLSYFCNILKPAWDVDKSLSKNSELKRIYKDLQSLPKDFKDHNLLPVENLAQMINGTASNKSFKNYGQLITTKNYADISTDESHSPSRKADSEIEEFRTRLESCEILSIRKKPLVTQEWINTLRNQITKSRA